MEIQDFIKYFAEQFNYTKPSEFKPDTVFRDLEEYSSLMELCIILMIDEKYGVSIDDNEMTGSETIEDLFNKVKAKINRG